MTDVDSGLDQNNPDLEVAAPERPDWLPSNFNDPADLAKSYQSAQAELTRAKQEAAAERAAREALEAQQYEAQQSQAQASQQNELVARYEQAVETGDYTTQLAIQAHIAQQAALQAAQANQPKQTLPPEFVADYADKAVAGKYGDWDTYKERAAGWLAQNSYLITDEVAANPNLLAQRLETAYLTMKGQDALAGVLPAQAPDLGSVKENAQTMSGAGARQPITDDAEAYWQRIANAPRTGFSTS